MIFTWLVLNLLLGIPVKGLKKQMSVTLLGFPFSWTKTWIDGWMDGWSIK